MCYKQKCKVVSLNLAHPVYYVPKVVDLYLYVDLYNYVCSILCQTGLSRHL